MMGLVKSEWIKLTTTKSAYFLLGAALLCSALLSTVVAVGVKSLLSSPAGEGMGLTKMTTPLQLLGLVSINMVWIAAVVSVTGEFRFSTLRTSFLVTPKRWPLVVAKSLVWALLTALAILVTAAVSLWLAGLVAGQSQWTPFSSEGFGLVARFAGYTAIGTLGAIGLAFLMRNAVGAVALLVVWQLAEVIVPGIPKVGEKIAPYLPFANGTFWAKGEDLMGEIDWSAPVALLWFSGICLLLWAAGLARTMFNDS